MRNSSFDPGMTICLSPRLQARAVAWLGFRRPAAEAVKCVPTPKVITWIWCQQSSAVVKYFCWGCFVRLACRAWRQLPPLCPPLVTPRVVSKMWTSRPVGDVYRSATRSDKVGTSQFVRRIDYFELDAISHRLVDGRTREGVGDIVPCSAVWRAATLLQRLSWHPASDCMTKRGLTHS